MSNDWDIAVIGGGPAGAAAAWTIARIDPKIAERTVIIEAGSQLKEKICAGCVTGRSWGLLKMHGMHVDVDNAPVDTVRFLTALGNVSLPREGVGKIVRRSQFDGALIDLVRNKGVAVHQKKRVLAAKRTSQGVALKVSRSGGNGEDHYNARVVIGADGATSAVRKMLAKTVRPPARTAIAYVQAPENEGEIARSLTFDFRPVDGGFHGYRWIFPAMGDGDSAGFSVGVCDFDPRGRTDLKALCFSILDEYGFDRNAARWREYPFYPFDSTDRLAGPGWVLAGEAAGSDNLLAEGISYAIESGVFAAEYVVNSLKNNDLSMSTYTHDYHWSRVGKELRTLKALAQIFYGPLHLRAVRAGLFNEKLCAIGGEILAGELEPRTKVALKIAANFWKTVIYEAVRPVKRPAGAA